MIPLVHPDEFYRRYYLNEYLYQTRTIKDTNIFELHSIENHIDYIQFPLQPHKKTIFDFLFLTQGQVEKTKNLNKRSVEKNQVFLVGRNQITSTLNVSSDVEGYYCHFGQSVVPPSFLNDLNLYSPLSEPLLVLDTSRAEIVAKILDRIMELGDSKGFDKLRSSYLMAVLSEFNLEALLRKHELYGKEKLCQEFETLLANEIYRLNKVSDFARRLHVTPNYLNKVIKKGYGKSTKEVILEMKLLEAKVLLRQSDYTIAQISYLLFNKDPSDFSRLFKKHFHVTPSSFRKGD